MNYGYNGSSLMDACHKYGIDAKEPVDAIYTPARLECDRGNPYIESLPEELTDEGLFSHYYTPFPFKPSLDTDTETQLEEIQMLRTLRLPLPFAEQVERRFRSSLIASHRARWNTIVERSADVTYADQTVKQPLTFRMAGGADSGIGMTLLGIGGCGKSETIARMLSRYPQVILHEWEEGRYIQITWIRVVTPANANLKDLYTTMAMAIDEALGNTSGFLTQKIRRERSVGMMADFIARMIRSYAIGAIVLDEVQNLDVNRMRESSLDSLMTLINTTKVSLVLVGTDSAMPLFFSKYYLARRTGSIIDATGYCLDRSSFDIIIRNVTRINWFREPFELTDDIADAIHDETGGIIDRIVTLWMAVQETYVSATPKPVVDGAFIHQVANADNPLMGAFTQMAIDDIRRERGDLVEEESGGQPVLAAISDRVVESGIEEAIRAMPDPIRGKEVYQKTIDHLITAGTPYNRKTVLDAVSHVMKLKSSRDADTISLVQKTVRRLSFRRSDRRPRVKDEFDMDKFRRLIQ